MSSDINALEPFRQMILEGGFPQVLYKYRNFEAAKKIISNKTMYFASPDSFNDPFDCNLSEVAQHTELELYNYFQEIYKKYPVMDEKLVEALEHYVSLTHRIKDDPTIMKPILEKVRAKELNSKGLLCLSQTKDSILMWSHYAANHKGIVLGFDVLSDLNFFLVPLRVNYVECYEPINYLTNRELAIEKILTTKSKQWEYEEEIRILKDDVGSINFNPQALKEIIFGCKLDENHVREIQQLCAEANLKHVNFIQAKICYGKFELEFIPLR